MLAEVYFIHLFFFESSFGYANFVCKWGDIRTIINNIDSKLQNYIIRLLHCLKKNMNFEYQFRTFFMAVLRKRDICLHMYIELWPHMLPSKETMVSWLDRSSSSFVEWVNDQCELDRLTMYGQFLYWQCFRWFNLFFFFCPYNAFFRYSYIYQIV
jgi:hypothetical protein